MDLGLKGKNAAITGSSQGIGNAIANSLPPLPAEPSLPSSSAWSRLSPRRSCAGLCANDQRAGLVGRDPGAPRPWGQFPPDWPPVWPALRVVFVV